MIQVSFKVYIIISKRRKFFGKSKGGENSESERHIGCWMLLCIAGGRSASPKKRGSWDCWLYKQRVVSDR